jgi:two-component system CheB/CheR fusion protein
VVGIGASAGGIEALKAFFTPFRESRPEMAFVVVQHLAPGQKSLLAQLLASWTSMPAREAEDGGLVLPGRIYVIPPAWDLVFRDGCLRLLPAAQPRSSVDLLFASLAEGLGERAVGIVLSGTGCDGAQGVRMVKGAGGVVLAQAPETAQFESMPRHAIVTGSADFVLPPGQMAACLLGYLQAAFHRRPFPSRRPRAPELLKEVFSLVRLQTTHDFSQYKRSTMARRIERRMALHRLEKLEDYLQLLRGHPLEVEALFHDLAISKDPANPSLYSNLGDILRREGRRAEEMELYNAAVKRGVQTA